MLLWLANPSLSIGNSKSMLAMTSLSANVIKYRSEHYPSHKVICKIQDRIARLQIENNVVVSCPPWESEFYSPMNSMMKIHFN